MDRRDFLRSLPLGLAALSTDFGRDSLGDIKFLKELSEDMKRTNSMIEYYSMNASFPIKRVFYDTVLESDIPLSKMRLAGELIREAEQSYGKGDGKLRVVKISG